MATRETGLDAAGRPYVEWRAGPLDYVGAAVWTAAAVYFFIFVPSNGVAGDAGHGQWLGVAGVLTLMVVVGPLGVWLIALRPRIRLSGARIIVVNELRTTKLDLDTIEPTVTAGYQGLLITYRVGTKTRTITASGIRKANLYVMLNKRRQSDAAAEEINRSVRSATAAQ